MQSINVIRDIEYAAVSGGSLTLDIYRPESCGTAPTVLYLHGGGWEGGDKNDDAGKRLKPLAEMGVAVTSANYRLAPHIHYPTQVHDVKAAVRWLRARGSNYGLQTERLGIWGLPPADTWPQSSDSQPTTTPSKEPSALTATTPVQYKP